MKDTQNWPDLAAAILDKMTGSNPEISFDFENLELMVPNNDAPEAPQGKWRLNGSIRIRTKTNDNRENQQ